MLPQGRTVEAPQDHVVVGVVYGVPEFHIMEQMKVRPKDVAHLVPQLLAATEHAPHPTIPRPQKIVRE